MTALAKNVEQLAQFVSERDYVSFVEAVDFMRDKLKMKVDGTFGIEAKRNLLLWIKLSEEAKDTLLALINGGRVNVFRSSLLVYMTDGMALTLPIAKRVKTYSKPHWWPATMRAKNRDARDRPPPGVFVGEVLG